MLPILANVEMEKQIKRSRHNRAATACVFVAAAMLLSCSRVQTKAEAEPTPDVRLDLSALGLPKGFFFDQRRGTQNHHWVSVCSMAEQRGSCSRVQHESQFQGGA